jgi:peptidoglycan/xylan/chitin deacetylase (PgdA/CDA1 family)
MLPRRPPAALRAAPLQQFSALFVTLASPLIRCLLLTGLLSGVAGLAMAASTPLAKPLHGSIRSVKTGEKVVALTFDLCESAGEVAGYDAALVGYLRANGVKATFFAGGKWLRSHPEQAGQLLADPLFEMGNHGWRHANLRQASARILMEEVGLAQTVLEALKQKLPDQGNVGLKLFRFPYGTCTPEALTYVNKQGLVAVQWDVVTGDPDRGTSAANIARTVLGEVHPGAIVIAHANGRGWHTAAALPLFVPQLRARGYRFVTVSELLAMGEPVAAGTCFERTPGDNRRYDRGAAKGTN